MSSIVHLSVSNHSDNVSLDGKILTKSGDDKKCGYIVFDPCVPEGVSRVCVQYTGGDDSILFGVTH